MKKLASLHRFILIFICLFSGSSIATPVSSFGTISIESMTQGKLLWLNGRVGEARYHYTLKNQLECIKKVPVAVGRFAKADIGISTTQGLTIIVLSQQLNDALIQGTSIHSDEWKFTTQKGNEDADGLIVEGIRSDEGFILNSRRKWISWFLGSKPQPKCF